MGKWKHQTKEEAKEAARLRQQKCRARKKAVWGGNSDLLVADLSQSQNSLSRQCYVLEKSSNPGCLVLPSTKSESERLVSPALSLQEFALDVTVPTPSCIASAQEDVCGGGMVVSSSAYPHSPFGAPTFGVYVARDVVKSDVARDVVKSDVARDVVNPNIARNLKAGNIHSPVLSCEQQSYGRAGATPSRVPLKQWTLAGIEMRPGFSACPDNLLSAPTLDPSSPVEVSILHTNPACIGRSLQYMGDEDCRQAKELRKPELGKQTTADELGISTPSSRLSQLETSLSPERQPVLNILNGGYRALPQRSDESSFHAAASSSSPPPLPTFVEVPAADAVKLEKLQSPEANSYAPADVIPSCVPLMHKTSSVSSVGDISSVYPGSLLAGPTFDASSPADVSLIDRNRRCVGRPRKYKSEDDRKERERLRKQELRKRQRADLVGLPTPSVARAKLEKSFSPERYPLSNILNTGFRTLPHHTVPYHENNGIAASNISSDGLAVPTIECPPVSDFHSDYIENNPTFRDNVAVSTKKRVRKSITNSESMPVRKSARIEAMQIAAAEKRQALEDSIPGKYENPKFNGRTAKGKKQFEKSAAACPPADAGWVKEYNNFYVAKDSLSIELLEGHNMGRFFDRTCRYCAAYYFPGELNTKGVYSNCCLQGKIHIDIPAYPEELKKFFDVSRNPTDPEVVNFREYIRHYNNMFSFASFGFKRDDVMDQGNGPYIFKIHGQVRHRIGSVHPGPETPGGIRKYNQLYMIDTDEANRQRLSLPVNEGTLKSIVVKIHKFMSEHNPFAKSLLMMREVEKEAKELARTDPSLAPVELQLYIHSDFELNPEQYRNRKVYNLPAANEVAIIFNSKDGAPPEYRHVAVHPRPKSIPLPISPFSCPTLSKANSTLAKKGVKPRYHCVALSSEPSPLVTLFPTHPRIDALTYPLLFPYGEFGWEKKMYPYIPKSERKKVRTGISAGTGFHPPAIDFAAEVAADNVEDLDDAPDGFSDVDTEDEAEEDVGALEVGDGCDKESGVGSRKFVTFLQHAKYRIHPRVGYEIFLYAGKLGHQYYCDLYSRILAYQLNYVKTHQKELRVELYSGLRDHLVQSAHQANKKIGTLMILPSSFLGTPRNMHQNFLDAMAVVAETSKPDFFLTMTCNPLWPEIRSALRPTQEPWEVPGIICRVFHQKVLYLIDLVTKQHVLGEVEAFTATIEFQKRGLPHLHMLLIMKERYKPKTPEDVDKFVSAMLPLPDVHPQLYEIVTRCMIHSPCTGTSHSCQDKRGNCNKKFPKRYADETTMTADGYPGYKRPDNRGVCQILSKQGKVIDIDNSWVVPYNPFLLKMFNCHINLEICSSIKAVKYIYKYVYKGFDRVSLRIRYVVTKDGGTEGLMDINEVDDWVDGRFLSAIESAWRLHGFPIHFRSHAVQRLSIHLKEAHSVFFEEKATEEELRGAVDASILKGTKLTAFFDLCKTDPFAATLLYKDVPKHYVYKRVEDTAALQDEPGGREVGRKLGQRVRPKKVYVNKWVSRGGRKPNKPVIGRITYTGYGQNELSCLRALLLHTRGPKSFDDIITIGGVKFRNCYEAAVHLGLVKSQEYFKVVMEDAVEINWPGYLRKLFVSMIVFNNISDAKKVYDEIEDRLSDDLWNKGLPRDRANERALLKIKKMLAAAGKSLAEVGLPDVEDEKVDNMSEGVSKEFISGVQAQCRQLNDEQKIAVRVILSAVVRFHKLQKRPIPDFSSFIDVPEDVGKQYKSNLIYLNGPAGSGKTFVYNTVISIFKCVGLTYTCVAPTGLAASLLDGGRTVHSKFKISVNTHEGTVSRLKSGDEAAKVIQESSLLIWDEISMCGKHLIDCVSKCYGDLFDAKTLFFGGFPVVCGGDFRQQPPVIKHGGRKDCLCFSVKASPIWKQFVMISLKQNMRSEKSDESFRQWLLNVGNGSECYVDDCHLVKPRGTPEGLIDAIFGRNITSLSEEALAGRAILCSKNEEADDINNMVLARLDGEEHISYSSDTAKDSNSNEELHFPDEFLHTLKLSGMPPHELRIKKDCVVMLLRNLDCDQGLCNGTRLIVRVIRKHVLGCDIISGSHAGKKAIIPKLSLVPSDTDYNFVFERYQFPVKLSYSMTIHKSQGQTFDFVGLYLKSDVFTHGQLYTALTRVKRKENLKIEPCGNFEKRNGKTYITNIVYPEMLNKEDE